MARTGRRAVGPGPIRAIFSTRMYLTDVPATTPAGRATRDLAATVGHRTIRRRTALACPRGMGGRPGTTDLSTTAGTAIRMATATRGITAIRMATATRGITATRRVTATRGVTATRRVTATRGV